MNEIESHTWKTFADKGGYRKTRKHFTLPKDAKLFTRTEEGKPLVAKMDTYRDLGVVKHTIMSNPISETRKEIIIEAEWTDAKYYHEFEEWYHANFDHTVKAYNRANDITHAYNVKAPEEKK